MVIYTPQIMFLFAFTFANFEMTRGSRGKANNYTAQKKATPQFSKFANEKARRNIIWGVYAITLDIMSLILKI